MEKATGAVVVGVDGSDASTAALDWAAGQAILEGRPLAVIHAAGSWGFPHAEIDPTTIVALMRNEGRAILQRACKGVQQRDPAPELRSELAMDDPRRVLLEASEHAHLLVVGSNGRGPVKSLLLGSVGIALTQHSRCPTVVRRPHHEGTGDAGVLVGTAPDRGSEAAVAWAFQQAALREVPLTLVHTVFDGRPAGRIAAEEPGHEAMWSQLREAAEEAGRRHPSVKVRLQLRRGLPDEALVQAAAATEMVVVGQHARRSILGMLDLNVPKGIVQHAPRYVAVVPAAS